MYSFVPYYNFSLIRYDFLDGKKEIKRGGGRLFGICFLGDMIVFNLYLPWVRFWVRVFNINLMFSFL